MALTSISCLEKMPLTVLQNVLGSSMLFSSVSLLYLPFSNLILFTTRFRIRRYELQCTSAFGRHAFFRYESRSRIICLISLVSIGQFCPLTFFFIVGACLSHLDTNSSLHVHQASFTPISLNKFSHGAFYWSYWKASASYFDILI